MNRFYRIITDRGEVGFATSLEAAEKKFMQFEADRKLGYSKWVKLVAADPATGRFITIKEGEESER